MKNNFILETHSIMKSFGITKALNNVNFRLRYGEIHGLIGENGSGKSTLSSIISGIIQCDSGNMVYKEQSFNPRSTLDAVKNGVCMIVQEQGTFTATTVAENIFIGKEKEFCTAGMINVRKMQNKAQELLNRLGMDHIDASGLCGALSLEDRKLIEIARAMYADPQILIIDETTTALSKKGREILYDLMEKMKVEGKSVIFISHDIDEFIEKCDALTVLRDGNFVAELSKEEFDKDYIKQLLVGREMIGAYYREDYDTSHGKDIMISVKNLTQGIISDVSFDVYDGEILGIGGLTECGMHELGRLIFGLEPKTYGEILFRGKYAYKDATSAMKLGIGYISKNRDKEAILTAGSIRDNIALPSLGKLKKAFLITNRREKVFVNKYAKDLQVKMSGINQLCMHLSGGNKQKVAIAKWMGFDPDVLIMDCPTRGIDIGVKAEIYRLIEQMKANGKTIILISEELSELIGMCDRILVMKDGKVNKEFLRNKNLKDSEIINYMI